MSAYISQLEQQITALNAIKSTTLEDRLDQWWASQPPATRLRAYSMDELIAALGTQGRYISPILVKRGWARHRRWQHRQHYFRVWLPPERHLENRDG